MSNVLYPTTTSNIVSVKAMRNSPFLRHYSIYKKHDVFLRYQLKKHDHYF